jgi:hypothetical protein
MHSMGFTHIIRGGGGGGGKIGDKQTRQDGQGTNKKADNTRQRTDQALGIIHPQISIELSSEPGKGSKRTPTKNGLRSEYIVRLEYDHYFKPTRSARFHADHFNLRIRVVQITNGESSEIFCSCSIRSRYPVNKKRMSKGGVNRVWRIVLRNVTEGVTF